MSDPRYLNATPEEMIVEYWARHYDDLRISGRAEEEEFEDEEFDLEAMLARKEIDPADWVEVIKDGEAD